MNKVNDRNVIEEILPVDKQKLKGKIKHVIVSLPGIDESWVTQRNFAYYTFPPTRQKTGKYVPGEKESWLETMTSVLEDIWFLCELQYHKFWSQILYDKEALNGVHSFLHLASVQKSYYRIEDEQILQMYKSIKKAVFQFLRRLTRMKESSLHSLSKEKYQEIMGNNVIPTSLIFCICSVYSKKNEVTNMISFLFENNYQLNLDKVVLRTIQLFSFLKKKLKVAYSEVKKCLENFNNNFLCDTFTSYRRCLVTVVQFLTNSILSISNFLSVYTKHGCEVFSNYDFEYHIIRVYKKLLIPLCQEIEMVFLVPRYEQTYSHLFSMLSVTRTKLLYIFNLCLQSSLSKLNNTRECIDTMQKYVQLMKFALKVEEFISDFNAVYKIEDISKMIKECKSSNIDFADVDQISESVTEMCKPASDNTCVNGSCDSNEVIEQVDQIERFLRQLNLHKENLCVDMDAAPERETEYVEDTDYSSDYSDWSKTGNSDAECNGYLTSDEEDFENEYDEIVESKYSAFDAVASTSTADDYAQPGPSGLCTASVSRESDANSKLLSSISAVQEVFTHLGKGFIAMCLKQYDMNIPAVMDAILENNLPPNLQEADFMLREIPAELLESAPSKPEFKELKKVEYTSYNEMLNDKADMQQIRELYQNYQNVEDMYDDDVEEDYDEDCVAAVEADPERLYTFEESPSNVDEDNVPKYNDRNAWKNNHSGQKPLDFCENPEITRARYEEKRRNMMERKYGRSNWRNQNNHHKGGSENVPEAEKEKRDRHHKNVHKSRGANHSRRFLSDRKRRV